MTTELHNTQTYAFSLRLLALLVENERRFMSIMDTDILTRYVPSVYFITSK